MSGAQKDLPPSPGLWGMLPEKLRSAGGIAVIAGAIPAYQYLDSTYVRNVQYTQGQQTILENIEKNTENIEVFKTRTEKDIKEISIKLETSQALLKKDLIIEIEKIEDKLESKFVRLTDKLETSLKEEIKSGFSEVTRRSTQIDDRILDRISEDAKKNDDRFRDIERRINNIDNRYRNK